MFFDWGNQLLHLLHVVSLRFGHLAVQSADMCYYALEPCGFAVASMCCMAVLYSLLNNTNVGLSLKLVAGNCLSCCFGFLCSMCVCVCVCLGVCFYTLFGVLFIGLEIVEMVILILS